MAALFWPLFGVDALVALIFVYFFFVGLGDGTVSSFNIGLWLLVLAGLAAVLGGGWWLRSAGHPRAAGGVLLLLAFPGIMAGLFLLLVLILQPRWN